MLVTFDEIAIIYDLIALAVVIVFCIVGYKKGFLATIVLALKWILAFVAAAALANPTAEFVFDKMLAPDIEARVEEQLGDAQGLVESYQSFMAAKSEIERKLGLPSDSVSDDSLLPLQNEINGGATLAHAFTVAVIRPVQLNLIQPICYAAIFALVLILCSILVKILKLVNAIPLIGGINQALGILGGAVYGFSILLLASAVLAIVITVTGNSIPWLNADTLSKTMLVRVLVNLSLFARI